MSRSTLNTGPGYQLATKVSDLLLAGMRAGQPTRWLCERLFGLFFALVCKPMFMIGVWRTKVTPASAANTPGVVINVDEGNFDVSNSKP